MVVQIVQFEYGISSKILLYLIGRKGSLLSTFLAHSDAVVTLLPCSPGNSIPSHKEESSLNITSEKGLEETLKMMKSRNCIVSIGRDHTVTLVDVDDLLV